MMFVRFKPQRNVRSPEFAGIQAETLPRHWFGCPQIFFVEAE